MANDLIRLMQSLFLPAAGTFHSDLWHPPADVYRTRAGWLIKFELAGVRPEDLALKIDGHCLTVRGCRRDLFMEEGCRCYRMEISYSHFERSIELPFEIDSGGVETRYEYGLLLVHIRTEDKS